MGPYQKSRILSFLGVCGCISCYVAMFPALLLGLIGVLGFSQPSTVSALDAYMGFVLFQPILIVSILFLAAGMLRYGKLPQTSLRSPMAGSDFAATAARDKDEEFERRSRLSRCRRATGTAALTRTVGVRSR